MAIPHWTWPDGETDGATAATVAVARKTGNLLALLAVGVGAVLAVRSVL